MTTKTTEGLEHQIERLVREHPAAQAQVGRRISELRRSRNMPQEQQLASRLDVSIQWLSRIENGRENLTLETISTLSHALGVEPVQLFTDVKPAQVRATAEAIAFATRNDGSQNAKVLSRPDAAFLVYSGHPAFPRPHRRLRRNSSSLGMRYLGWLDCGDDVSRRSNLRLISVHYSLSGATRLQTPFRRRIILHPRNRLSYRPLQRLLHRALTRWSRVLRRTQRGVLRAAACR